MRWGVLALLLAACHGPTWTEERALVPFLAALDRDGSGAVEVGEWDAVAWAAPPFAEVDGDGDGRLGTAELAAQLRGHDPTTFDAAYVHGLPPRMGRRGPKRDLGLTLAARSLLDLFAFLADEARAAGFSGDLPDREARRAAADAGDLADPAVQALLLRYAAAWTAVGLTFPEGLPAAAQPAASGAPGP